MEQSDSYRRGMIFFHRGNLDGAKRCFEEALEEVAAGSPEPLTTVLVQLANVHAALGEREKAALLYERVLALERKEDGMPVDLRAVGLTLVNLGNLFREKGERERAQAYYLEGADLLRQAADDLSLGILYSNFGLLEDEAGRSDEAVLFFKKAIDLHKKMGHEEGLAATWGQLGRTLMKRERDNEAEICFNHASTHFSRLGDPAGEAEALRNLSRLYEKRGEAELALQSLISVLEIHRRIASPIGKEDEARLRALRDRIKKVSPAKDGGARKEPG